MPVEEAPDDDSVRQSYNFAPGYHGLVYRADGPDYGGSRVEDKQEGDNQEQGKTEKATVVPADGRVDHTKYKLQAMKWGMLCESGSIVSGEQCADMLRYPQAWFRSGRSAIPTTVRC